MQLVVLLHHLHLLSMVVWDVENGFDGKGHIGVVVQLVFVRNLRVAQLLVEHFVLVLGHLPLVFVPDCLEVVHGLSIQLDWILVENRVLFDDFSDFRFLRELN